MFSLLDVFQATGMGPEATKYTKQHIGKERCLGRNHIMRSYVSSFAYAGHGQWQEIFTADVAVEYLKRYANSTKMLDLKCVATAMIKELKLNVRKLNHIPARQLKPACKDLGNVQGRS